MAVTGWYGIRWLQQDEEVARGSRGKGANSPVEATGAESIIVRENGEKRWEFSAHRIVVSADGRYATATGIGRAVLYRNGKPYLKLRAQQLRLNQQTKDLEASGEVTADGPDGFSVKTERAQWNNANSRLHCPRQVLATLRGLKFDTSDVTYDAKARQLYCPRQVRVDSSRATLTGSNAEADVKARRVEMRGPMEMTIRPEAVNEVLSR